MNRLAGSAAAALVFLSAAALADPGYYVVTVYAEPGVKTVDFRYWTVRLPGSSVITWPELGLGWNINSRWYSEVLASYVGSHDFATRLSTVNWQNDVLLTQGQYPFDLGVHTLLVLPQSPATGHTIEIGPVFQTDIARTQVNVNLILEHEFGVPGPTPTSLKYQWQLRHHWRPWLHIGAQGFGEVGPWNHWSPHSEQSHRAGPAVFGTLLASGGVVAWQASYLFGSTYGQRGNMFSMRVKYDF